MIATRQIIAASATGMGKVRQQNEDACFVDASRGLFIVSDGMGGHQAGAAAAQIVVQVLPKIVELNLGRLRKPSNQQIREMLRDGILVLSRQLREQSVERAGFQGMGATVVVALVRGRYAHIAHLGDSRAYLFRDGRLKRLTEDHSIVGILLRNGQITPEEARDHPARGRISRHVGMEGDADVDVRTIRIRQDNRLLLCTDGLTGMLSDERIVEIIADAADPQAACQCLIDAANAGGGKDNTTAIVCELLRLEPGTATHLPISPHSRRQAV